MQHSAAQHSTAQHSTAHDWGMYFLCNLAEFQYFKVTSSYTGYLPCLLLIQTSQFSGIFPKWLLHPWWLDLHLTALAHACISTWLHFYLIAIKLHLTAINVDLTAMDLDLTALDMHWTLLDFALDSPGLALDCTCTWLHSHMTALTHDLHLTALSLTALALDCT